MSLPIRCKLPENFLEEEVRSETIVPVKLKKIWAVQLDLLKTLLDVCAAHDIKVIVWAGTLLGAVRHKGFIPWDDDVDIAMDRENFKKLLALPASAFPEPSFLQTAMTDKRYFLPYARFRNSRTTCIISGFDDKEYNNGIYIDVFPLDGYSYSELFVRAQWFFKSLLSCIVDNEHNGIPKNPSVVARCVNILRPLWRIIGRSRLVCAYDAVLTCMERRSDRISEIHGEMWEIRGYWMFKRELTDLIFLPFENLQVPVPACYREVLSRLYGEFMNFPPVEKRGKWHEGMLLFEPDIPYREFFVQKVGERQ